MDHVQSRHPAGESAHALRPRSGQRTERDAPLATKYVLPWLNPTSATFTAVIELGLEGPAIQADGGLYPDGVEFKFDSSWSGADLLVEIHCPPGWQVEHWDAKGTQLTIPAAMIRLALEVHQTLDVPFVFVNDRGDMRFDPKIRITPT